MPQGSVLGHLLLVLFINDLNIITKDSNRYMNADYTKILRPIKEHGDCQKLLQNVDVYYRSEKWLLNFHLNKFKCMRMRTTAVEDQGYQMEIRKKKKIRLILRRMWVLLSMTNYFVLTTLQKSK